MVLASNRHTLMHVAIWEFTVREGAETAFEQLYGPEGAWVALFRGAEGYVGTELLRAADAPRRYVTIDRWISADAYAAFRQRHAAAYRELDAAGEALTESERLVGEFLQLALSHEVR